MSRSNWEKAEQHIQKMREEYNAELDLDIALDFISMYDESCSCPTGHPPCSYCTHEANPIAIMESNLFDRTYWRLSEDTLPNFKMNFQTIKNQ
jgi:hypothetical protein